MVSVSEEIVQPPAIPESLIYETLNGRPFYYKGYRAVVTGPLNPEAVLGSSDL